MRILIVGAGAIGSFLGARLALVGHVVVLVGRQPLVDAVRSAACAGGQPDGERQAARSVAATSSIAAAFASPCPVLDLALITVKAYDTAAVIAELRGSGPACTGAGRLLTLQNGVGNEEALAEAFGAERVLSGAIDTPVSVPAPGQVRVHRRATRSGLASAGAAAPPDPVAEALRGAGFNVSISPTTAA